MSTTSTDLWVLAFTEGAVYGGLLGEAKTQIGSVGLTGPDVSSMELIDPVDGTAKVWAVDGTDSIVIDPIADTVDYWGANVASDGAGNFPTHCALTCAYFGCAVLARQPENESVWYMSRILDPLDWEFAADPPETAAAAGSDPAVGQPGDSITCLLAYKDDYLIFGCKSSIYWLVGHPGSGGRVQRLTPKVGIVGPKAACFDENGNLYFMAPGGFYRMLPAPGAVPECVSGKRMYELLDKLDTEANRIELAWNSFRRMVLISIRPLDGTIGTHVLYDPSNNAFWPITFPSNYGPTSICECPGTTDADRQTLLGCADGYIRRFDTEAFGDDRVPIDSWVRFAPIALERGRFESMAQELSAVGADGSGLVIWHWFTGASAIEVNGKDFGFQDTYGYWFQTGSGYQYPASLRLTAGFHQLVIRQLTRKATWAIEEIQATLAEVSRRRPPLLVGTVFKQGGVMVSGQIPASARPTVPGAPRPGVPIMPINPLGPPPPPPPPPTCPTGQHWDPDLGRCVQDVTPPPPTGPPQSYPIGPGEA